MIKNLISKLIFFLKLDLRRKFQKLNIYPKNFHNRGILGLYNKFLFIVLFNYRYKKYRKKIFKKIFNQNRIINKKNFLVSLPRSGSMFVRCMLSSYNELYNRIGDGHPKYDSINDKWIFASRPISESSLWGLLEPEKFNPSFFEKKNYGFDNDVVFCRYPISEVDLFEIEKSRPVILFRSPLDQIVSLYNKHQFKYYDNVNEINFNLMKHSVSTYLNYKEFWLNFCKEKKKKEDYLLIKYENLIDNSVEVFSNILKFYNYPLDVDKIKKSVEINSKETTLNKLKEISIKKIRFTDPKKLEDTKNKIQDIFYKEFNGENLIKSYKEII